MKDPLPNGMGDPLPGCTGDVGRTELVDAPVSAEEGVAMMDTVPSSEQAGTVLHLDNPDSAQSQTTKSGAEDSVASPVATVTTEVEPEWVGHLRSIDIILGGSRTIALHQEFLIRNNSSDLQVLKNTKVRVLFRGEPGLHSLLCWGNAGIWKELHHSQCHHPLQRPDALWYHQRCVPARQPGLAEASGQLGQVHCHSKSGPHTLCELHWGVRG